MGALRDEDIMLEMRSVWLSRGLAAAAFTSFLWGSGLAGAAEPTAEQRVETRLRHARLLREAEIRVSLRGDTLFLDGAVATIDAQRRAETLARKEARHVENRMRVVPVERSDEAVGKDVVDAILGYPRLTVFDSVELGVQDGIVVLQGSVRQPYRREEVEARVAKVAGVREIRNGIAVQPVSIGDDRLRAALFRAIYGDQRFRQYLYQSNPPIHIVVERGRVTLTGVVATRVEQVVLGHVARGVMSFGVENRVTVEGAAPREPVRGGSET